jgi:hypothetical protein
MKISCMCAFNYSQKEELKIKSEEVLTNTQNGLTAWPLPPRLF